jgi:cobalt-zinc-cadmium efflux system outer membrane protein
MITQTLRHAVIVLILASFAAAQVGPAENKVVAQVAGAPAPQAAAAGTVSVEELVSEALEKNPAVQAARHRVEALRHRVPQAKSLPDPKISAGWMGNATPFDVQEGDPSSYRGVAAMQELPFPGKLKLRGEIADKEAEAAWWQYEATRRRVAAEVKAAYYDYFYYDKALGIIRKDKDLLEKLSQIAQARYRVGKGIQQDVLKAQTELSLLLQRLTILEQQRQTAQVRLNTLLSRDPETPLPAAADVQPATLNYTLDELYQLAARNDTGLQREQSMIERSQLVASLARKDYYPDFGVGYMYQQRPLMPDMHGVTVTVNIPVFYKSKQREAVREATEELLSIQRSRDNRQNELNFALKQEYLAAQASRELFQLYSQAVVPQASLALESSMSAYQVGTADFLTILANFGNVLQYEVDYYRELANYQAALARLEPLVGVDLTLQHAQQLPGTPQPPKEKKEK